MQPSVPIAKAPSVNQSSELSDPGTPSPRTLEHVCSTIASIRLNIDAAVLFLTPSFHREFVRGEFHAPDVMHPHAFGHDA